MSDWKMEFAPKEVMDYAAALHNFQEVSEKARKVKEEIPAARHALFLAKQEMHAMENEITSLI